MKLLVVLALFVAVALARPEDFYDSKYDDFNMDEVVANERLLKAYAHCFIGDGKCTPEGAEFKKLLPEATQSSCAKCTEKQKALVAKAINAMEVQMPAEFKTLIDQNDPGNKHQGELNEFLAKYSA